MKQFASHILVPSLMTLMLTACSPEISPPGTVQSLNELSVDALSARAYGSEFSVEKALDLGTESGNALILSYRSDDLLVYARADIPAGNAPPSGFPAVIFVHGWIGAEAAPTFDFFQSEGSFYGRIVKAYRDAGFVVLSPAWRGHGTVNGRPADGLEFLQAWDNASYLSPVFYTIDTLNLLDSIDSLDNIDWSHTGVIKPPTIDRARISIAGHSQGGDVTLTALAVSGEGSQVKTPLAAGSIISGCFAPRFEQLRVYGPMAETREAFIAGDGRWNGTAIGEDGRVNPDFIFGWPPDWIGTTDFESTDWTWQADTWSIPTVKESLNGRAEQMYSVLNNQVANISNAEFRFERNTEGKWAILHDPQLASAMQQIGGFDRPDRVTEPLYLHHSNQDYYSLPEWNSELAQRVNEAGGHATNFTYPKTSHALQISPHQWFSPGEVLDGVESMLQRDIELFLTPNAAKQIAQSHRQASRGSPEALSRYARNLRNEFSTAYKRAARDGIASSVMQFSADGLTQYALVLEPTANRPESGWPVLIFSHGYHPDPPRYGVGPDGVTDRPGDYYRDIPLTWAKQGFLVIAPDFRGHNQSQKGDRLPGENWPQLYARDVIAAVRAIPSLQNTNPGQVFLTGHSMGALVTLHALFALGSDVSAASLWSGCHEENWQSMHSELNRVTTPLSIQHSSGDRTCDTSWSRDLLEASRTAGIPASLRIHTSNDHLFKGETLESAIEFDYDFFTRSAQ